jgi:hypothetical protein
MDKEANNTLGDIVGRALDLTPTPAELELMKEKKEVASFLYQSKTKLPPQNTSKELKEVTPFLKKWQTNESKEPKKCKGCKKKIPSGINDEYCSVECARKHTAQDVNYLNDRAVDLQWPG